jgi:hypothetical protein
MLRCEHGEGRLLGGSEETGLELTGVSAELANINVRIGSFVNINNSSHNKRNPFQKLKISSVYRRKTKNTTSKVVEFRVSPYAPGSFEGRLKRETPPLVK